MSTGLLAAKQVLHWAIGNIYELPRQHRNPPEQPFEISLRYSLNTRDMEHNDWILDKIRAAVEVVSGRILIKKWEDTSSQQYRLLISANIRTMCPCRWEKCQTSFICRSVCLSSRIGTESPKTVSIFFKKVKRPFSLPLNHWLIWSCDIRYFLVTGCHVMPLKLAPCSMKSLLNQRRHQLFDRLFFF